MIPTANMSPIHAKKVMDGRFFDTRRVEAYIADGSEKFRKSGERKAGIEVEGIDGGDDDEEGKRLDEFGSWLEGGKENQ